MQDNAALQILSTLFSLALVALVWVLPIVLGIREAKRKGISPHWMWFGVNPLPGWIAYLIIKFKAKERTRCAACGAPLPPTANYCSVCRKPREQAGADQHPPALPQQPVATTIGLVRWGRGRAQCPKCLQFMPLVANVCPACGGPAVKMSCQSCRSQNTTLFRPKLALVLGILLAVTGSVANDLGQKMSRGSYGYYARGSDESGYLQVGGVLVFILGGLAIWFYLTRRAWRLRCADCHAVGSVSY